MLISISVQLLSMVQGVKEAVMVQCYNDCPEEVFWVLEQAKVNRVYAFS
jgi:hypothetical protein